MSASKKKAAAAETPVLSGKAQRYLRGLGHALEPVVTVGKEGITSGLIAATSKALTTHELIKVRIVGDPSATPREDEASGDEEAEAARREESAGTLTRHEAAEALAKATKSALAQVLGKTFLLYRPNPEKKGKKKANAPAKIVLPQK